MAKRRESTFLKVEVRPGMFSDERVVVVHRPDGDTESFFVPKDVVNEENQTIPVEVRPAGSTMVASITTGEGKAYLPIRPDDIVPER